MSEGIRINGEYPKSKKAIKDAIKSDPETVTIDTTSAFVDARTFPITVAPIGQRIDFVGPDPYTNRKFYGSITRTATGFKVV